MDVCFILCRNKKEKQGWKDRVSDREWDERERER